ncbi:MAG: NAD(P)H-binding protein [Anaerolineales bacterium]|nr:NAD(P)H-binding protein [Anaerolineales bacterium]
MNVVTGSYGYIGKYITRELLEGDAQVKTITTHPNKPNPFGERVVAAPYNFEQPDLLTQSLAGCETLFNTYWVRFDYRQWSFARALEHTKILFRCAKAAGVKKVVHISVTNPAENDALPYYQGKALQEKALRESGLDYAIVRPTLVFGKEDILVNNIAWTIRKFPVIPIFGSGQYQVHPVFAGDLAKIAVDAARLSQNQIMDAIGPETFTYAAFLKLLATELDRKPVFIHLPPAVGILLGKIIGLAVRDVVLTRDELRGLMANKLTSPQVPNGETRFSAWLHEHRDQVGRTYTSELQRHFYWRANRSAD